MPLQMATALLASESDPISHIVDKSVGDSPVMLSMITMCVCAFGACWLL